MLKLFIKTDSFNLICLLATGIHRNILKYPSSRGQIDYQMNLLDHLKIQKTNTQSFCEGLREMVATETL